MWRNGWLISLTSYAFSNQYYKKRKKCVLKNLLKEPCYCGRTVSAEEIGVLCADYLGIILDIIIISRHYSYYRELETWQCGDKERRIKTSRAAIANYVFFKKELSCLHYLDVQGCTIRLVWGSLGICLSLFQVNVQLGSSKKIKGPFSDVSKSVIVQHCTSHNLKTLYR